MKEVLSVISYDDFFDPIGKDGEYLKKLVLDLGDVQLDSGVTFKHAYETYRELDSDPQAIDALGLNDSNKRALYAQYLLLAENDDNEYDADGIAEGRKKLGIVVEKAPMPDVEPKKKRKLTDDQIDGFGYPSGTQPWWLLDTFLNRQLTFEELHNAMLETDWKCKKGALRIAISRIKHQMKKEECSHTIFVNNDKTYSVIPVEDAERLLKKRKRDKDLRKFRGSKHPMLDVIEKIKKYSEGAEMHVEITEDSIRLNIKNLDVEFGRTKEAERIVGPMLLKQEHGIEL